MMKQKDDVIASKKKPEFIDQVNSNGNSMRDKGEDGEGEGSDAELAAQDFLDAVKSGDPKLVVDAFMALDAACDAYQPEGEEDEDEDEDDEKPKGIVSIILGKKKPG